MEIKVMHQVMEWNEDVSDAVKAELAEHQVCLINVMGSPGAGKTSMIVSLINRLRETYRIGVIEGDIAGQVDADTIHAMGIPVVQLDTDGACHIEAMSIQHLLKEFSLPDLDIILVENIGNLVCPAEFSIGEHVMMLVSTVTEGSDKPYKYPLAFEKADLIILNKVDLMPYLDFDEDFFMKGVRALNKDVPVFKVSGKTGEGFEDVANWLMQRAGKLEIKEHHHHHHEHK